MNIFKTVAGSLGVAAGVSIAIVGGSLEYVFCVIGNNSPDQSFFEWSESQQNMDNLNIENMMLTKAGMKLAKFGVNAVKDGIKKT